MCVSCESSNGRIKLDACVVCGGVKMAYIDSSGEFKRYWQLKQMQSAGLIRGLTRQVPFDLMAYNKHGEPRLVARYVADYTYDEKQGDSWKFIIEDYKKVIAPDGILKLKFMAAMGNPVRIFDGKKIID